MGIPGVPKAWGTLGFSMVLPVPGPGFGPVLAGKLTGKETARAFGPDNLGSHSSPLALFFDATTF